MTKRFLMYISENYSFEILRPVQNVMRDRGYQVAWFVEGDHVNLDYFSEGEKQLVDIQSVVAFQPDAVFVPGNVVPDFIPGLKVQVFHGFEWKKKGHFRIRGMFDLYCTQGPLFTKKFNELAQPHRHFQVIETGWPKMDVLFNTKPYDWAERDERPTILFAPTFSPALTSAPALFKQIKSLSQSGQWQWLIKFHPKMDPQWQQQYKELQNENLKVIETQEVAGLLHCADVLLSDTSSIITEFTLLNKPVVTFANMMPESHLLDFSSPDLLESKLSEALAPGPDLLSKIKDAVKELHPYSDGDSASRVLDAALSCIEAGGSHLKRKPYNLIRNLKLRKKLGYWRL
ncbi:CDP-glycerol glycerophosphotransferase family protein [Planctobacterium marinum]|uniref:CDP-glycerol--glycerophosphate glycerophosphotransferase n=1 Tax=Planctobacterium marinum TaxID=1631968 RepID=A0AA48HJ43_9ALTE|nr:CDP-glycerol--glycerophosphate glycerophosphotransferase [Planctobacterium marinum]